MDLRLLRERRAWPSAPAGDDKRAYWLSYYPQSRETENVGRGISLPKIAKFRMKRT
jgi:hypothetical protein